MANFEFSKNEFKFQILGMMFSIPDNKETSEKLIKFSEKIQAKGQLVNQKNQDNLVNEVCNDCYKLFDNLLGANASKKIFKNREKNIFDCIELTNFISSEIEIQRNKRLKKYSTERINKIPQDFKKKK